LVRNNLFREDLFYRLAVITINVPPLRERNLDILLLAEHFVDIYNTEYNRNINYFSKKAKELLLSYPWPGNVRELKNAISQAVIFCSSDVIDDKDLKLGKGHIIKNYPRKINLKDKIEIDIPPHGISLEDLERAVIIMAFEMANGNKAETARLLRISRETLRYRLRKHKIKS
jgi:DNA-binding NtrC family response regulator